MRLHVQLLQMAPRDLGAEVIGMDCLLVFPYMLQEDSTQKNQRSPYPPLGLMYVAASLRNANYEVKILDCTFMTDREEAEASIRTTDARYVGIHSMVTLTRTAIALAKTAKSAGKIVIYGGPDPSTAPEKYLKRGFGDYVVMGEGEKTAVELLQALDRGETTRGIKGLAFLTGDGSMTITTPRELEQDLNSIPLPARDLVDNERYKEVWRADHGYALTSIMTTRGCPYGCFFCSEKLVFGRRYTLRSAENVLAELIQVVRQLGYDRVWFADDIFPLRKERTLQICEEILDNRLIFSWSCLARADLVDEEALASMKRAGCEIVFFGVESGSQRMLDAMNRMMTIEQIVAGIGAAKRVGLKVHAFMMVGFPGENYESLKQTIGFLKQIEPDEFSFTVAYPLPGTELFHMIEPIDEQLEWRDPSENKLLFESNIPEWTLRFAVWKARYEFYLHRRTMRGQKIFLIALFLFRKPTDLLLKLAAPKEATPPKLSKCAVMSEVMAKLPR
jgi:anaerobic magnesium-protoporphyrin IX monomethyl ester cyclase